MMVDPIADRPRSDIDRSKLVEFRLMLEDVRLRLDHVRLKLDGVRLRLDHVRLKLDRVRLRLDQVRPRLDQVRPRPDFVRPGLVELARIVQACSPRHVKLMFSDQGTVEVTYVLTQWSSIVSGGGLSPGPAVLGTPEGFDTMLFAHVRGHPYIGDRPILLGDTVTFVLPRNWRNRDLSLDELEGLAFSH
jgi:hypothetical protein